MLMYIWCVKYNNNFLILLYGMAKNRVVNVSNRMQGLIVLVVILLHSIYSVYCVTTILATSSTTTETTPTTESLIFPTSPLPSTFTQITHQHTTNSSITTSTTTPSTTRQPSVLQAIPTTTTSIPSAANRPIFLSDDILISESVIMPSMDSEKEAKDLYDKALKQYGSYGASARNICATWEARGCQCSGSVEELALSCRGIGFEEVPLDLPLEIVKL